MEVEFKGSEETKRIRKTSSIFSPEELLSDALEISLAKRITVYDTLYLQAILLNSLFLTSLRRNNLSDSFFSLSLFVFPSLSLCLNLQSNIIIASFVY